MRFASPEWALLALPLVAAALYAPRLGLRQPLRALWLALAVLLLTGPELRVRGSGLDLWVLVDRSASAEEGMAERLGEWEQLLERARGPNDRVHYVSFAAEVARRDDFEGARYAGDASLTRTALAVQYALSALDSTRSSRILVLTDGYSTEPLAGLAERLREQQVALDYRLLPAPSATDYRVTDLRTPQRASVAEPFLVEVELAGTRDGEVGYEVMRDGQSLRRARATLQGGAVRLRFADRLSRGGAHRYEVRLDPGDAFAGNDSAFRWIDVMAGPRVLAVTSFRDDPLVAVLRERGFEVDVVAPGPDLEVGRLAGARAVLLNDVPAHRLPGDFLAGLDFFVREQGGGLWMTGGRSSFGSGGYFESRIDALLPVSMELREEQRKLAVAMAIVMDRSGSMGMLVPSGGRSLTKMELASAGAARAVELLGDRDLVTVYAVDSLAHQVVGLTEVGAHRRSIDDTVRRIASQGGGIFVYTGLAAAWKELQEAEWGQRHVVLFADAADAEEPGEYVQLLDEMARGDATVSVIGLGGPEDTDAAFLQDIARRGNGRLFFAEDAAALPALFAQETVALARSAFIDEPVDASDTGAWLELAARPIEWPASVDGYNLSYLRPGASAALRTADEDAAPLVAFWQRGLGRVAAVSFPLAGELSERARAWPGYGAFAQTLVGWLMGEALPPGLSLGTRVDGTELTLDLRLDDALDAETAVRPPRIVLLRSTTESPAEVVWQREAPGHLSARIPLDAEGFLRGAVQTPWGALPFGPLHTTRSVEWSFDPRRRAELAALAAETGGSERLDLADVWDAPRSPQFTPLAPWLILALLSLLLADTVRERLGLW